MLTSYLEQLVVRVVAKMCRTHAALSGVSHLTVMAIRQQITTANVSTPLMIYQTNTLSLYEIIWNTMKMLKLTGSIF